MFVLDTDHLGIVQNHTQPEYGNLSGRMRQHRLEDFFVTIVSFQEQVAGWNLYIQRARDIPGLVRGYAIAADLLLLVAIYPTSAPAPLPEIANSRHVLA